MLPLSLEMAERNGMSLLDVLRTMTIAPAELMKLPGGRLAKGAPADLVLFDPDLTWTVDGTALHSKSKNTPFDGRRVKGRAVRTVVGGRSVYTLT